MPLYRVALTLGGVIAVVVACVVMDTGAWVALAAGMIVASQFVAENVSRRRSSRIGDLEARVAELVAAQSKCEARLQDAYRWIEWARQAMVLKPDAPPNPFLC